MHSDFRTRVEIVCDAEIETDIISIDIERVKMDFQVYITICVSKDRF